MSITCFTRRIVITGLLLGLISTTQSGCLLVVAAAGAGTGVAYYKGSLESVVEATPDRATEASRHALEDLNIRIISANGSGVDGEIVARTAGDDKVAINVKGLSEKTSKLTIRIGYFGDQAMSTRILAKINERIAASKKAAPEAPMASGLSN